MVITHIPNGYNSISELLRSPEFKKFRKENRIKGVTNGKIDPDDNPPKLLLEKFLKSLEIRTFDDI